MTEEQTTQEDVPQEPENQDAEIQASDASGMEEQPKKEINQEAVNQAINKQHKMYKEEAEKRAQIEAELEEVRKKLNVYKQKEEDVTIPPMPDQYDDDYDAKIKAREDALTKKARIDHERQLRAQQAQQVQQAKVLQERQKMAERQKKYDETATHLGVDKVKLQSYESTVANYIKNKPGIASYLLENDKGPLIVQHLAENMSELTDIQHMNDVQAAVHIATNIVPKLTPKSEQIPKAPAPSEPLQGAGPSSDPYPFIEGATFE